MKSGRGVRQVLLSTVVLTLAGCGYHVAGHNDVLPKSVQVIAVPAMENKTSAFRIEQKLTAATIHELLAKTRYKVVSDANGGDAVLRGKVLSVEVLPLIFQTETQPGTTATVAQATTMIVTMKCEVTLTQRDTDKVLYHADNFVFRGEYQLASSVAAPTRAQVEQFFQEGDPAVDRMAQDFARTLVSAVTENF